jgi:alpha-tubulin suppressor-like RCC1 family protein
VRAGAEFSVALLANGQVMTWGRSNNGQLGSGGTATRRVPGVVSGLPAIAAIGCGRDHALAVSTTGTLWGWGLDNYGQLGDTAAPKRLRPVQAPGVTGVTSVAGGYGYSVIHRRP